MVDGYQPLTDSQWQVIAPLLPAHGNRRLCLRQVFDAMRYLCRTGCQWRSLPGTFPAWTAAVLLFPPLATTTALAATQRGRQPCRPRGAPSARRRLRSCALIAKASSSRRAFSSTAALMAANASMGGNARLLPTLRDAFSPSTSTPPTATTARLPARGLLPCVPSWGQRLTTILTDQGYRGRFADHVRGLKLRHELASRPPTAAGFVPVAKRWVVERTFAWLAGFRRLAVDYEYTPASHEAWLLIANTTMGLNRIATT